MKLGVHGSPKTVHGAVSQRKTLSPSAALPKTIHDDPRPSPDFGSTDRYSDPAPTPVPEPFVH
ncbi:hypothetical protein RhiXN_09285 [Rhizoctonia solani]|uniref:Uncharacterized protein n=1 Tax=Rhizoctonia solani TaxID=456999 RepID=A0A8H8NX86_9AGAM|nr:uncharacterized protein RhiXN_09285 [Rhizoctonia solani]QRW20310.1 hypothetical protein RhiXN_09285 [Rhizoctonia solani]